MGKYQVGVIIITISLLIVHTFGLFGAVIDIFTFLFLFVLILIPLLPQIHKLKFGNFELERILDRTQRRLEVTPPLKQSKEKFTKTDLHNLSEEIGQLLLEDHILALAKLRMELEKAIRRTYVSFVKYRGKDAHQFTTRQMIHELEVTIPKLDRRLLASVKDVSAVCNRAIHGGEVSVEQAQRIVELGLKVIALFGGLNEAFEAPLPKPDR